MVDSVFGDGRGGWNVKLFNPWGKDGSHNGMSIQSDGVDDGFITISWATFEDKLSTIFYT